ncbi:MAG: glycoside hydrolase family 3 C-terminal domain-containing protein [Candidatus Izimaplasma sp.]|nr:glycoside hydrolase family 3 C-terminal domain-containing protein [Candidatus Izimaplasma bacterium]
MNKNIANKYPKEVINLLEKMTLDEKVGQLYQAPFFSDIVTGHEYNSSETIKRIKKGLVGSILNIHNEEMLLKLQKTAVEDSRLGIPLIFCFDIVHGYKTAFPINLALSNSWDCDLIKRVSTAVAYETAHRGIHLTFSPMVDLVRDPRWGRVMESNGEDPYLSSILAKAYVEGYQQNDLSNPNSIAACSKHFIGYGQSEAGRDYNTVDMSKRVLYNMYLPPFISTIKSEVSMIMTSFNTIFDRPSTANKQLLKGLLRDELGFKGSIISDYTSTEEIINHKVAKDIKDAAYQCFDAGLDIEMVSETYINHLKDLIEEGAIKENDLDESVLRILKLKFDLGLLDNPYSYFYENSNQYILNDLTKSLSKEAAEKSMVLLKNDNILPLETSQKILLCGPMIDSQDVIGEWSAMADKKDVTSILSAFSSSDTLIITTDDSKESVSSADVVVMALGELGNEAGEGNSKTNLYLKQEQTDYFEKIYSYNKNIVVVIFAGRPLIITKFDKLAKAVLYAYQPGLEAGPAIKSLLMAESIPSGKITMTFPYHEGQIPIYYNHYQTGRPFDFSRPKYRYNTRYQDCQNEPLYPFGYGLSYATFKYENLSIDKQTLNKYDKLLVTIDCTNQSSFAAEEIIQLYIEALTFSVARPVNELKAYKKIMLKPKEKQTIQFELSVNDFRSYNLDMIHTAENHKYKIKVGPNSKTLYEAIVNVIDE